MQIDLPWMQQTGAPKTQQRLPVVLTTLEVQAIFRVLDASHPEFALFAKLLYGTGMRIMEAARLRIKDVDFEQGALIIREAKGGKEISSSWT